jgi:hypothetical protein
MSNDPRRLLDFKMNVFSQTGEDGVIAKCLEILPNKDKWCVEFGASDGVNLSNTRNLVVNAAYSSIQIEANKEKCRQLTKNYETYPDVEVLNCFVGFGATDGLDSILASRPVPPDFDFLSIDVDGNDFHIWRAVKKYRPKLVCIEFNPSVPTEVDFVQPADPGVSQGASLTALVALGKEKNYELVSVLSFNAIFVDAKYYPLFELDDNRPETLRTDLSHITWLFTGYDGNVFLSGSQMLPWHRLPIKQTAVQQLPAFLRHDPATYGWLQKRIFHLLIKLSKLPQRWQKKKNRMAG